MDRQHIYIDITGMSARSSIVTVVERIIPHSRMSPISFAM